MTDTGAAAGTNTGTDTDTGGGSRDAAGTNGPATLREVARLAQRHGFGESRAVHALGGGDVGCVAFGLAVVLLAPGIGLVLHPYNPVVTSIGVTFLVLALALPITAFRYEKRRDNRIPRLHVFDGGIVITRPARIDVHPWPDIRVVEREDSVAIGQGGTTRQVHRLELHAIDGDVLCSLGDAFDTVTVVRTAIAGGAHTS
ncbi:hypothetical protein ACIOC1_01005 [Streptomyces sp. NPDC088197]|uniref:hypothetical protein n=1 Tax=Streptomyces sp. NPDC088197 TaxID=3365840 RepID=UPI0038057C8F